MVNSTIKPTIVDRGPSRNVRQSTPSEVQFLARELHDRVIQEVWCLDLELSDLRAKVEAGSPDAVARLDAVRGRISTVYDELRLALSELRNDTPIDRPFDDAVQSLLLDFSRKTNIDADYSPGCPGVLFAKTTQLQLIAILRHAVANVHQHAHATHITVKTETSGPYWSFSIADDGIGFDKRKLRGLRSSRHAGLGIMEDRAKSIRASLTVSPREPRGTIVKVCGSIDSSTSILETIHSRDARRGGNHEHQITDR